MKIKIFLLIILITIVSCGKKSDPEYKSEKKIIFNKNI